MKRAIPVVVVVLIGVGVVVAVMRLVGGCGTPNARVAERRLYHGPSTMPADASEWPRWRGPFGDGISREANLAEKWPAGGPPELWSAEVGLGYASPVAAGGRVYVFSMPSGNDTLTCFDANTGRILWNEAGNSGRSASYPGTRATPAIDGNDIVTLGGAGELTCRDVTSGAKRWSVNVLKETGTTAQDWGTASSPLISGNFVFVQTGQGGPVAVAVDRADGKLAWKSQAAGNAGYASPVLANVEGAAQLIVFGGKALYGMDPATGRTLWEHPWATSYDVNASTPVHRDGRVFITSGYGVGAAVLQLSGSGPPKQVWQSKQAQSRFQPAILDGDALYVNSESGGSGTFTCLDWNTGNVLWKDDNQLKLGLGGSFVRIPNDRMITLGERGTLSLASVTPHGLNVISSARLLEGTEIWAVPLIYGGRLYVKGTQELVCYDLSGGAIATRPTVSSAR
jgi:outer membrane protein assembly factor BamB